MGTAKSPRFGTSLMRSHPTAPATADSPTGHAERIAALRHSPSYRQSHLDPDFMGREELRPVRLQLELLKPELVMQENGIASTIVVFGGTRVIEPEAAKQRLLRCRQELAKKPADPRLQRSVRIAENVLKKAHYYEEARELARIVSTQGNHDGKLENVICTGGGPGIMEAANRGAHDVGAKSIGLNIKLPAEQQPNPFITPELCFQFKYFALRKFHFILRAAAVVLFPGGFGTLDEMFETLTLRQTHRMQPVPIILFGHDYWSRVIDFQYLADSGVIADHHLDLFTYAETPAEAWQQILDFHARPQAT